MDYLGKFATQNHCIGNILVPPIISRLAPPRDNYNFRETRNFLMVIHSKTDLCFSLRTFEEPYSSQDGDCDFVCAKLVKILIKKSIRIQQNIIYRIPSNRTSGVLFFKGSAEGGSIRGGFYQMGGSIRGYTVVIVQLGLTNISIIYLYASPSVAVDAKILNYQP